MKKLPRLVRPGEGSEAFCAVRVSSSTGLFVGHGKVVLHAGAPRVQVDCVAALADVYGSGQADPGDWISEKAGGGIAG